MPLTNLNLLDPATGYLNERNNLLKRWENDPLFRNSQTNTVTQQDLRTHTDSRGFIAIGYGLDLLHNSVQEIAGYFIAANIQLPGHTGIGLSQADLDLITAYQADPFNNAQALLNGFPALPSEADATALLNFRAAAAENQLDQILGFHMGESRERAALASLAYNNASALLGPKLRAAIQADDRAEAWYQIRYVSNGGASQSPGIANRRIVESNRFSLYNNSGLGVGEAEAKLVLRMYTTHAELIRAYESRFLTQFAGGPNTIQFQLIGAKTTLIPLYAHGYTIDGEVLVGQEIGETFHMDDIPFDLSRNDLLFGEGGHDSLYGHGGDDVLYGGDGRDILVGGSGNDRLEGGAGFDTYRWYTGDGHDVIEDSDADGVIYVNGRMLVGGVKKEGHTYWENEDGRIKYEMSGADLVVKLDNDVIMTVNENFQSGQFWIRLIDMAEERMAA